MKYGFIIPNGDPRTVSELARRAEDAGWDGAFYWDGIYVDPVTAIYDPWVVLAAMAMRTERVRIGAIVTPVSRRRPWKLARETVTLDHLSGGRLVLAVGLGAVDSFGVVGEVTDRATRAELLDETLAILTGLWSAQPFQFSGKHYQLGEMTFNPGPVQAPRIPIWVVGAWRRPISLARALRYDGILPNRLTPAGASAMTAADVAGLTAYIADHRMPTSAYEVIADGVSPGDDSDRAQAIIGPFADAGATWWLESRWLPPNGPETLKNRIDQGPPRL